MPVSAIAGVVGYLQRLTSGLRLLAGDPRAAGRLVQVLSDPGLQATAIEALRRICQREFPDATERVPVPGKAPSPGAAA